MDNRPQNNKGYSKNEINLLISLQTARDAIDIRFSFSRRTAFGGRTILDVVKCSQFSSPKHFVNSMTFLQVVCKHLMCLIRLRIFDVAESTRTLILTQNAITLVMDEFTRRCSQAYDIYGWRGFSRREHHNDPNTWKCRRKGCWKKFDWTRIGVRRSF